MAKKSIRIFKILLILFFCICSYILICTPFEEIRSLPSTVSITNDAINQLNISKPFGKFINFKQSNTLTTSSKSNNSNIQIKLLNFITLKNVKVGLNSTEVYVGGDTVGFSLNSKGVMLLGHSDIISTEGKINTLKESTLSTGDIILKINETPIEKVSDLNDFIKTINNSTPLNVTALRNNEQFTTTITPAYDIFTKCYKLGIWVKDETSGVGTLTYINKDNGNFGALGHAISDSDTNTPFNVKNGDMFTCSILGIKKGAKGKPGEVRALFLQKNPIGSVNKNTKYGIFGNIPLNSEFLQNKLVVSTGGRLTARPGKAKIITDISGTSKMYDVEIIKTNYQNASNEKSMVLKVTDPELLKLTGGIVQGMSGSPIIQNDKIIGAVTHVFVNDPSKGFGIYLDWMLEN